MTREVHLLRCSARPLPMQPALVSRDEGRREVGGEEGRGGETETETAKRHVGMLRAVKMHTAIK